MPIQIGPTPASQYDRYQQSPTMMVYVEAPPVDMTATEYRFEPSELLVEPGQIVTLNLINRGEVEHSLRLELHDARIETPDRLAAGESHTIHFPAPTEPGVYTFYCPVRDHRERGMEGRLIVREPR